MLFRQIKDILFLIPEREIFTAAEDKETSAREAVDFLDHSVHEISFQFFRTPTKVHIASLAG